MHRLMLDGLGQ